MGGQAWGLDPTLLRETPWLLKYLFGTSSAARGSPAIPLMLLLNSLPVYQSVVVKYFILSVCGYKASFPLVFSWLVEKMISLQFSCNSRLVLGGG